MDSSTPDFFFALLRSGLYGTGVPPESLPTKPDWQAIVDLARKQTVMGVVFDAVSRLPADARPPKDVRDEMLRLSLVVMNSHRLLDSTLARVEGFYRRHGIRGVLLKGQGIARCYRNPSLRQCGDIDLYIGKKDYRRSVLLAKEHLESGKREPSESVKHYHFQSGRVTIELHRIAALMQTPFRNGRLQRWAQSELEDEKRLRKYLFDGVEVYVPSADFDAFFIFYHGWHHFFSSGIGMRQLCDWVMVLHSNRDAIDRERLGDVLKSFGFMKTWQVFGCLAVDWLGLPEEEFPFYDAARRHEAVMVMKRVLEDGNFGFYSPGRPSVSLLELPLMKRKIYLLRRLFKTYGKNFRLNPLESTCHLFRLIVLGSLHTLRQLLSKSSRPH